MTSRKSTTAAFTAILEADGLSKQFAVTSETWWRAKRSTVYAVDNVSFRLAKGECLSLVGESGCGKSTTAKLLLRLIDATTGHIRFKGKDITELRGRQLKEYRSSVQAVMQDPWSSLNPRMRIEDSIAEPMRVNDTSGKAALQTQVGDLLEEVGLDARMARDFPHEFSGGQRQRIAIARALSLRPEAIIFDEPVSALDVSVGAQVMNLLRDLQEMHELSYVVIAHNLATVRYLSDRVAVMYLGQIVETTTTEELFTNPLHPYTKALIAAARFVEPGSSQALVPLEGEVPSPDQPPPGCRFSSRCPYAFEQCYVESPPLRELGPDHLAACHLY